MFGYVIGSNDQKQQDELVRAIGWNIFYGMRFLTIIYVADTTSKQVSVMKIICNNYRYIIQHYIIHGTVDGVNATMKYNT